MTLTQEKELLTRTTGEIDLLKIRRQLVDAINKTAIDHPRLLTATAVTWGIKVTTE